MADISAQEFIETHPIKENPYIFPPQKRRVFGEKIRPYESDITEIRQLQLAAKILKNNFKDRRINKRELGERTGKAMVRYLDRLNIPMSGKRLGDVAAHINLAHKFYREIYEDEYYGVRKGFLAEYAAMRSVYEWIQGSFSRKYADNPNKMPRVEYPTNAEDMHDGVDFIINFGSERKPIAVQVKCFNIDTNIESVLFPVTTENEAVKLIERFKIKADNTDNFTFSVKKSLQNSQRPDSVYDYAYMVLPSPESSNSVFNETNGLPIPELTEMVGVDIKNKMLLEKKNEMKE